MMRLFSALALSAGLAGYVAAPPTNYGYEPTPAYGYGPGYYAARAVSVGIGVGGDWGGHGGWHGR